MEVLLDTRRVNKKTYRSLKKQFGRRAIRRQLVRCGRVSLGVLVEKQVNPNGKLGIPALLEVKEPDGALLIDTRCRLLTMLGKSS